MSVAVGELQARGDVWCVGPWTSRLLVAVLVMASHAALLGTGFLLDDYPTVKAAGQRLEPGNPLYGGAYASVPGGGRPYAAFVRPLLHLSLRLDRLLWVVQPGGFHAGSVALLLVACLALLETLALALPHGRPVGLAAAALLALHPGKHGAVAWVAARGDLLVAVCGLLAAWALVAARRRRAPWMLVPCVAAAAGALLAKESGVVVLPALVAVDLGLTAGRPGRWWSRLWLAGAMVLLGAGYLLLREHVLGAGFVYAGQLRDPFHVDPVALWRALPPVATALVSGAARPGTWNALAGPAALVATLGLMALSMVRRGGGARRSMLLVAGLTALLALPALRVWDLAGHVDPSRFLAPPAITWCVMLGTAVGAGGPRTLGRRRAAWGLVGALLVVFLVRHVEEVAAYRVAGRTVEAVLQGVAELQEKVGPQGWVLVENVPDNQDGVPVLGYSLHVAAAPPFRRPPLNARACLSSLGALRRGGHLRYPGPLITARWDPGREQVTATSEVLPAPGAPPEPREVRAHAAEITVAAAPRSIPSITCELSGVGCGHPLELELAFASGSRRRVVIRALPRFTVSPRRTLLVLDVPWLLTQRRLAGLSLRMDPAGPLMERVRFDRPPRLMEWVAPRPDAAVPLEPGGLEVAFRCPGPERLFRLEMEAGAAVAWSFTRSQTHDDPGSPGVLRWRPAAGTVDTGRPQLPPWDRLQAVIRRKLREQGLLELRVAARILVFDGDPEHPTGGTNLRWLRFTR